MTQERITQREERIKTTDDLTLFVRSCRPDASPRAILAVVPGFNSHSGYYTWTGEQFPARGLETYAVDVLGRGRPDGERSHVDESDDYVSDVAALVREAPPLQPAL